MSKRKQIELENLYLMHDRKDIEPLYGMDFYGINDTQIKELKAGAYIVGHINDEYTFVIVYKGDEDES